MKEKQPYLSLLLLLNGSLALIFQQPHDEYP
ncbi:hypothetical protein AAHE18_17G232700 [Arachis hypogaea]